MSDDLSGASAGHAARRAHGGRRATTVLPQAAIAPALPQVRSHLDLAEENGGAAPWCGPATLALAAGRSHAEACERLRAVAPAWYPATGPIVTAYWRDLLAVLRDCEVPYETLSLPEPRPTLLGLVRQGLEPGWYLLRVTDHFLLLRSHGFGLVALHDNRHTGVPVTYRTHGRRKVTHAARLLGGSLVQAG